MYPSTHTTLILCVDILCHWNLTQHTTGWDCILEFDATHDGLRLIEESIAYCGRASPSKLFPATLILCVEVPSNPDIAQWELNCLPLFDEGISNIRMRHLSPPYTLQAQRTNECSYSVLSLYQLVLVRWVIILFGILVLSPNQPSKSTMNGCRRSVPTICQSLSNSHTTICCLFSL